MHIKVGIHLAVQQDPAIPVVDWPVFHSWSPDDGDFEAVVFLLDSEGAPVAETRWELPTDLAADQALERLCWVRCEPWHVDDRGRRVAAAVPMELDRPKLVPTRIPRSLSAGQ
jgi:hypothetical protein